MWNHELTDVLVAHAFTQLRLETCMQTATRPGVEQALDLTLCAGSEVAGALQTTRLAND